MSLLADNEEEHGLGTVPQHGDSRAQRGCGGHSDTGDTQLNKLSVNGGWRPDLGSCQDDHTWACEIMCMHATGGTNLHLNTKKYVACAGGHRDSSAAPAEGRRMQRGVGRVGLLGTGPSRSTSASKQRGREAIEPTGLSLDVGANYESALRRSVNYSGTAATRIEFKHGTKGGGGN